MDGFKVRSTQICWITTHTVMQYLKCMNTQHRMISLNNKLQSGNNELNKQTPETLTGPRLVKKFPAFYRTRKFITTLKSACHRSLSSAKIIKSMPPHPTSWRSILISSSHQCLGLPSGLLSSGFPTKTLCAPLPSPIHLILLDFMTQTISGDKYRP